MKRLIVFFVFIAFLVALPLSHMTKAAVKKKKKKKIVAICHFIKGDSGIALNIPAEAAIQHLARGDCQIPRNTFRNGEPCDISDCN